MDKASGRFSTRLNRSRWAATSNCLSNVTAFGTRHLLGHGIADAAHSSGRSVSTAPSGPGESSQTSWN